MQTMSPVDCSVSFVNLFIDNLLFCTLKCTNSIESVGGHTMSPPVHFLFHELSGLHREQAKKRGTLHQIGPAQDYPQRKVGSVSVNNKLNQIYCPRHKGLLLLAYFHFLCFSSELSYYRCSIYDTKFYIER